MLFTICVYVYFNTHTYLIPIGIFPVCVLYSLHIYTQKESFFQFMGDIQELRPSEESTVAFLI